MPQPEEQVQPGDPWREALTEAVNELPHVPEPVNEPHEWPDLVRHDDVLTLIDRLALPSAPDHRLREALTKIAGWQTHGLLTGRDAEAMAALAYGALAVLSEATPGSDRWETYTAEDGQPAIRRSEPALDATLLAEAMRQTGPSKMFAILVGHADSENRLAPGFALDLARVIAAEYRRLSASQTPEPDIK